MAGALLSSPWLPWDWSHDIYSDTKVQKGHLRTARARGTNGDGFRSYVRGMGVPERQNTSRIMCGWDI